MAPTTTCCPAPAPHQREAEANAGGDHDLTDGTEQHHPPHSQQIGHGEMQAHAEHQQHDADLGQLAGDDVISDEAGVKGPTATPATR